MISPGLESEVLARLELPDEHSRGPDAGETVGLQLHPHRKVVGFGRILLLQAADLLVDSEHVLHVMSDLVREDVGRCQVAGGAEA